MARRTVIRFIRLMAVLVAAGVATLALAAPASALFPKDPDHPRVGLSLQGSPTDGASSPSPKSWELVQVASVALGGIALAGVGVASAAGLRRLGDHTHPAS